VTSRHSVQVTALEILSADILPTLVALPFLSQGHYQNSQFTYLGNIFHVVCNVYQGFITRKTQGNFTHMQLIQNLNTSQEISQSRDCKQAELKLVDLYELFTTI
jgi:hypothetical protein